MKQASVARRLLRCVIACMGGRGERLSVGEGGGVSGGCGGVVTWGEKVAGLQVLSSIDWLLLSVSSGEDAAEEVRVNVCGSKHTHTHTHIQTHPHTHTH